MTPAEFIDAKGGPAIVARATGYKPGAVALWRHRNKIPRTAWPEILEAFSDTSLADLKGMEAAPSGEAQGPADERPAA